MNWNKRMEEMVGTWTDMQKQLWNNWLQTVNSFGGKGADEDAGWQQGYQKNLDAWERSVRQALDAQSQWAHNWADKISQEENTPEVVVRWVAQLQEMMKGWTEAQGQLWNAWFDSVKHLDPAQAAGRWETEGQQVLQAWKEATQRAQEALTEWSQSTLGSMDADKSKK